MTILIFGASGQVGSALMAKAGSKALGLNEKDADLGNPPAIIAALERAQPKLVINAAAYTVVDRAEGERTQAFALNATAPGIMAQWCAGHDVPFVHYSTDYVFDGSGDHYRDEDELPAPLNVYGESKLAGEEAVEAAGGKYLIFRTSWVYDAHGRNFLNTMLRLAKEQEELRVVADQHGAPTYASHLAAATLDVIQKTGFPSGIYHLCNRGETTWHGFAEAIFAQARAHGDSLLVRRVMPIGADDYPAPAQRPYNSRLDCSKAERLLGITMPNWEEGLNACMEVKYGH